MKSIHVNTFRDLMGASQRVEIVNPLAGNVVRKLTLVDDGKSVAVDAISAVVIVGLDDVIRFEPWVFDRGNMIFTCEGYSSAKLCAELDIVRFQDGTEALIEPAVRS